MLLPLGIPNKQGNNFSLAYHVSTYNKEMTYPWSSHISLAQYNNFDHLREWDTSCYLMKGVCVISSSHKKWYEHEEPYHNLFLDYSPKLAFFLLKINNK
jgi:hypothetical protein